MSTRLPSSEYFSNHGDAVNTLYISSFILFRVMTPVMSDVVLSSYMSLTSGSTAMSAFLDRSSP